MAVLWILVMVGAVGVAFQTDARAERRAAANARSALSARWAARAGLHRTLYTLDSVLQRGRAPGPDAGAVLPAFDLAWGRVSARSITLDARARLNLNLADDAQLRRVFVASGLGPSASQTLAAAVIDWRDADGIRSPGGAEAAEYAALRPPSAPKNALFDAVEELRDVFGVTPSVYERVAPNLTVSGDGRINVNAASVAVLTALPGIDADGARDIVARRRAFPLRNPFDLIAALPRASRDAAQSTVADLADRVAFGPRALDIVVTAQVEHSPVGITLWAQLEASGGTVWRVVRVVERYGAPD